MENLALIGTVAAVHLLTAISPGPDFLMAVKNSLTYSRKTGIFTAAGFGLGISVHIFYSLAGLAVLISKSILIFNFIKIMGAAYLMYIGAKAFLSKSSHLKINNEEKKNDISPLSAIKIGFLTNVLNPKATLFFLGLFTLVISPETPRSVLLTVAVIMVLNTILWFSLVAIFFTQKRIRSIFERCENFFTKLFGGFLILLGIKIAISRE